MRLLVCDDSGPFRGALCDLLSDTPEFEVVGQATSGEEAVRLAAELQAEMVVIDVEMPGLDGIEATRQIVTAAPEMRVVGLTAHAEAAVLAPFIEAGAAAVCVKGSDSAELLRTLLAARTGASLDDRAAGCLLDELVRVRRELRSTTAALTGSADALGRQKRAHASLTRGVVDAFVTALAVRDGYTAEHSERGAVAAGLLTARVDKELAEDPVVEFGYLLHDIGKLSIPDAILAKTGPLDEEERGLIEGHVRIGASLLAGIPNFNAAREIVAFHHERWDGLGYPAQLAGDQIPLTARIFAICDAYDAMTSDRPYRKALSFAAARDELESGAGSTFDPHLVSEFLLLLDSIDLTNPA